MPNYVNRVPRNMRTKLCSKRSLHHVVVANARYLTASRNASRSVALALTDGRNKKLVPPLKCLK